MKALVCAAFLLVSIGSIGQPSRDMTAKEVEFGNTVSTTLINSLPKEFKDWIVNAANFTPYVVGETRTSNCNYGRDCFWNYYFHTVYDGTTIRDAAFEAFADSMKNTPYDWHMAALYGRFTNNHQLVVDISVNETSYIGDFKFCGPKGYKELPAPTGFDHYLFATVTPCFPQDAQRGFPDVNLFIIGQLPTITAHGENGAVNSSIVFNLNKTLPSPYKIQNVVVRMYGSKALAKEFLAKMDVASLRKLLTVK